jgi:signal transduction histidine kinase
VTDPRLLHDLRSPLARAQTYAKLLEDAAAEEVAELLGHLRLALDDLEKLLRAAEQAK